MSDNAQLQQWFAAVDTDRSGRISVTELQEALLLGNLQFSLAVCAQMIRLHDRSNTNSLDVQDFMALHKFLEEMNQSFQMHDQDRSGFNLEPPAFAEMCRAFDPERKGQISYAPYIAMTLFLRCAANAFQAFDSSKMGRVNLDFSQFIYAASNCR
ncbi:MAG: Calcium-dependent kinase 23 isoform 1 [Trebouxia sp. A1-2]|nr:MAG: Calcium-dependent kinase 23 isoform 1 [Trebouxia sp. A1-2]